MKATPFKAAAVILLLIVQLQSFAQAPLANAFAHNDYSHKHPLFDALQNGYGNLEADIFLKSNRLVIAHINPYFKKKDHVLEKLYFEPLLRHINENRGQVYRGYNKPVLLMIDIKTEANSTYAALKPLLEKYRNILTTYDNGKVTEGLITVVLSGHKPYDQIRSEKNRLAFIDEDLHKVTAAIDTVHSTMFEMASCKYSSLLNWRGDGKISDCEHDRLVQYVQAAHSNGERVRLWASPDNKAVWNELLRDGVDLINTDNLPKLRNFLTATNVTKADRPVSSLR